jgi:NAD(P)-dependent dehydrogenase (short-subunit alcohol dehydrogenase family)
MRDTIQGLFLLDGAVALVTGSSAGIGLALAGAYLTVRYVECVTRPVRVHPSGCGCNELDCEYSRIRESFEFKLLWSLPASHTAARQADSAWAAAAKQGFQAASDFGFPAPPCLPFTDDPWVVLATIRIPTAQGNATVSKPPITSGEISFLDRRVLYSTTALQVFLETGV